MTHPNNNNTNQYLLFLKLGGSLITDKMHPGFAKLDVIERLAREIRDALQASSGLYMVLGHGSGSFGHVPAKKYATRNGVKTATQWKGFAEVWREAHTLNRIVVDKLIDQGLSVVSFPPSASVFTHQGEIIHWNLAPIRSALHAGLLPVIYGDVVFDDVLGGTILSTEDLFEYLAKGLKPCRILLAGMEQGVCSDFPDCNEVFQEITSHDQEKIQAFVHGSEATDVTGGMYSKVLQSLNLVKQMPDLEIYIFSGNEHGVVKHALLGETFGTLICAGE
jgi:isopentenyl phosphate kinase